MRNDSKVDRRSREFVVRTHRVYTPQALEPGREIRLEEQASHYLGRVLRVAAGQGLVLFNGDGHEYAAEVLRPARTGMTLRVDSRLPGLPESPLSITVVQALSRGERMAETLQKCTELGAAGFQLLDSERVEVRLRGDKLEKRMAHWRGVIVSACEQCGRSRVPELAPPLGLDEWLQADSGADRLVLDPGAYRSVAQWAADVGAVSSVQLAIGPEGGFSDAELARLRAAGVEGVNLGPRILRTETAAPAAVAILQALVGDLGTMETSTATGALGTVAGASGVKPVSLKAVVDQLEVMTDGLRALINRNTGEIIEVSDELEMMADADNKDEQPEWAKEAIRDVRRALDSEDFIDLPDTFDIHQYRIMKDFCWDLPEGPLREDFLRAIRGSGAFRRFKDLAHARGIVDDWYRYRDDALARIARDFLEVEGIPYIDDRQQEGG